MFIKFLFDRFRVVTVFFGLDMVGFIKINLSTMLSTATLEGAHTSNFIPKYKDCNISSTTVVVFPVPGGPWMRAI